MAEKPVSLIRKETSDALAEVVNSSGLPMFVIVPILKDLLQQAAAAEEAEYRSDLAKYNASKEKSRGGEG